MQRKVFKLCMYKTTQYEIKDQTSSCNYGNFEDASLSLLLRFLAAPLYLSCQYPPVLGRMYYDGRLSVAFLNFPFSQYGFDLILTILCGSTLSVRRLKGLIQDIL